MACKTSKASSEAEVENLNLSAYTHGNRSIEGLLLFVTGRVKRGFPLLAVHSLGNGKGGGGGGGGCCWEPWRRCTEHLNDEPFGVGRTVDQLKQGVQVEVQL
uniref:Uncharacterized protein n=1 Tax=Anopheles farauti TaxID=69004 RepID=A0A182QAI0_9DIPT